MAFAMERVPGSIWATQKYERRLLAVYIAAMVTVATVSEGVAVLRKDATMPARLAASPSAISSRRWSCVAMTSLKASVTTRVDADENGYSPSTTFSLKMIRAKACINVRTRNTTRWRAVCQSLVREKNALAGGGGAGFAVPASSSAGASTGASDSDAPPMWVRIALFVGTHPPPRADSLRIQEDPPKDSAGDGC